VEFSTSGNTFYSQLSEWVGRQATSRYAVRGSLCRPGSGRMGSAGASSLRRGGRGRSAFLLEEISSIAKLCA
jgi:hypothetical protein